MDLNRNKGISALSSDGATLAKVIATFCVVLAHSYKLFGFLGTKGSNIFYLRGFHYLGSSSVPVFFLLSGYFLTVKDNFDYPKNLKKKYRSLVIPYCVFILIYAIISCLGSLVLPSYFDDFRKFTVYDWLMHFFGIPFKTGPIFYGPLWFVRELIIFNILSFILIPVVKKTPGCILIPAMIAVFFLPIPQAAHRSIPFFLTGMYFGMHKRIPILNNPIFIMALFIFAFTVPIIFMGELSAKLSVLFMTCSVLMISGKLIEKENVKRIAGIAIPFSFPIYLMHEYPMTAMMRLLALQHIPLPAAVAAFFIAPIPVIFLCVCVTVLWKRTSPKTFAFCTGGRY